MGIVQKKRSKAFIACCILLFCLCVLVWPQTAYAAPANANATFVVDQVFTRPEASAPADTFTYELTPQVAGNPMPAGSSAGIYAFSIKGTGSVNIGPAHYTQTGVYSYEIRQVVDSAATGYTYDRQVYTVQVHVSSASKADIIVLKSDGSKAGGVGFENQYKPVACDPRRPPDPFDLVVDPPVKKTVLGNPAKDSVFVFKLEAKDKKNPMPPCSENGVKTITIVGSGEKDFGPLDYTDPGTYYYTVSEVNTGESGYTYDTSVYTITDSVKDVKGTLVLARTITNGAGKPVSSCDFINKYTPPAGAGGTAADGGKAGPKTGDDSMTALYRVGLAIGGLVFFACLAYLLLPKKRKSAPAENR